jgi:hypothetical protein
MQSFTLVEFDEYLTHSEIEDYSQVITKLNLSEVHIEGVKVLLKPKKVSLYFDNTTYCCMIHIINGHWTVELGSYDLNKHNANYVPDTLSSGTKTIYFLSALSYVLGINELSCLDSAMLPNIDLELSIIRMTIQEPSFYEKFGYKPKYTIKYQQTRQLLTDYAIEHLDFYTACYLYVKRKIPFKFERYENSQLLDIIDTFHRSADTMVKTVNKLDLTYWLLTYS